MTLESDRFDQLIFISDVHLGAFSSEENDQLEDELIALIDYAEESRSALFVLGDVFDYWMEYPNHNFVPSLGKRLLDRFEVYNSKVFETPYITGNHDHWSFGHFEERGFKVDHSFQLLTINNRKVLLTHGDGLIDNQFDLPLPALHTLLKNDSFIKLYQVMFPPSIGLSLMKLFSKVNKWKKDRDEKALNDWAASCLSNHDLNVIICGHDHIPRVETISSNLYINLGTFYEHKTIGLYKNNEFSLVIWDAANKSLNTFRKTD